MPKIWRSGVVLSALPIYTLLMFTAGSAGASFCALDHVPAATVLVPYFEVDLGDADGATTLVHLHNAAPEATLVKVTFWTDRSVPSVNFDLFLTGYDVVRLDLRDVFAGNIPLTADEQSDPGDTTSPHGANPEWDGSFTYCENVFPSQMNPVITGDNLERLVDGHTGQPVTVGEDELCFGLDHGDGVARGYLTIDDVERCAPAFPSDPGYFGGNDPVASNDNQLWAEVWFTWPAEDRRTSVPAVHLEAADGEVDVLPGTFYQRFSGGADLRERLPTRWGAQAFANAAVTDDWIVWRDGGSTITEGHDCLSPPPELNMNAASCFDQQESLTAVCQGEACLPLDTQKVEASDFAPDDGWCDLDLSSVDIPGRDPSQAWVGVVRRRSPSDVGDASVRAGAVLGGACRVSDLLFEDGFESGDTTRWSVAVGGAP